MARLAKATTQKKKKKKDKRIRDIHTILGPIIETKKCPTKKQLPFINPYIESSSLAPC